MNKSKATDRFLEMTTNTYNLMKTQGIHICNGD